jgi:hypothetical protein
MGLINLLTDPKNFKFYNGGQGYTGDGSESNLKNLPYGNDRIYNGNSKQPYITYSIDNGSAQVKLSGTPITGLPSINLSTNIPSGLTNLDNWNNDFILRGGTRAITDSAIDVIRLTKWFTSSTSPNGLFFVSKQQLLSRTAVRSQTSGILNEGIYSPLNTLVQAGVNFSGTHLNKQGLNPFQDTGISATNNQNLYGVKVKPNQSDLSGSMANNRLVKLYKSILGNKPDNLDGFTLNDGNVLSYSGGPGSTLGIGRTNIRFADQRTGKENIVAKTNSLYFTGNNSTGSILNYIPVFSHDRTDIEEKKYFSTVDKFISKTGVSKTYVTLLLPFFPFTSDSIYPTNLIDNEKSVYTQGTTFPENSKRINDNNTYVYTQNDIIEQTPKKGTYNTTQDFRKVLRDKLIDQPGGTIKDAENKGLLTAALSYNIGLRQTIETRVNLGDPGNRGSKSYANYSNGVTNINSTSSIYSKQDATFLGNNKSKNQGGNNGNNANTNETQLGLDKINSLPIYKSGNADTSGITNDLVKFRIAVIDNSNPVYKTFVHFRAFLDSMSDSYTADWSPTKYLGRGENFYNYNGFTRQISLSWTVAAQSKQELIPMYKKLNYLASSLTPEYSPNGYMRGNMVQLTIGGYLYEQPGIITGLTYNIEENTPWEIGISTKYDITLGTVQGDSSVKELPHVLRVTGFNFIPIHRFRPELQNYLNDYKHYIALANGEGADMNNYKSAPPKVADTVFQTSDPSVDND